MIVFCLLLALVGLMSAVHLSSTSSIDQVPTTALSGNVAATTETVTFTTNTTETSTFTTTTNQTYTSVTTTSSTCTTVVTATTTYVFTSGITTSIGIVNSTVTSVATETKTSTTMTTYTYTSTTPKSVTTILSDLWAFLVIVTLGGGFATGCIVGKVAPKSVGLWTVTLSVPAVLLTTFGAVAQYFGPDYLCLGVALAMSFGCALAIGYFLMTGRRDALNRKLKEPSMKSQHTKGWASP